MTWTDDSPTPQDWSTKINVSIVERVKELTDILLTDCVDGTDLVARLNMDVILLANVLYAICKPQCDARGMTDEQFGELLAGDVLEKAYKSLMEDLTLFFPSRRRVAMEKTRTATEQLEAEQIKLMEAKLTPEQIDKLIQRELEPIAKKIDEHLGELGTESGKSPES